VSTTKSKTKVSERELKRRDKQRHQKPPPYTVLAEPPLLPVEQLEASTSAGAANSQLYARPPPFPGVGEPAVYTIQQFCDAHDISYGHFYAMQRNGTGPKTMKMGTRRVISVEEARRWREARTAAEE
jgi:hypothetical protein